MSAPPQLAVYKAGLVSHRGSHGRGKDSYTDDQLIAAWNRKEMAPCDHIVQMANNGLDMQLISPRTLQEMRSEKPGYLVEWYIHECNKIIADSIRLCQKKFFGVGGLPQQGGEPVN